MSKKTTPPTDYQTKIWINKNTNLKLPETEYGVKQNTGVCFSGGGTRALSATMGQLRGLQALNLIDSIDYISCVSGGSWASALFTYYKSNPNGIGPITDADFLGPVVAPHDIVVNQPSDPSQNWLGGNDPKRMGYTATKSLAGSLLLTMFQWSAEYLIAHKLSPFSFDSWKEALENLPYNQLWIASVGATYFQQFGLFKNYNPFDESSEESLPFYSLSQQTVTDIRQRSDQNPEVKSATFNTVRDEQGEAKRPYLVINSCVLGPSAIGSFSNLALNPIGFEYTPLYIGSAYSPFGKPYQYPNGESYLVGNGYVEPFAFGGDAPTKAATSCQPTDPMAKCTAVAPPPLPFTLVHASGISSSAFASAIAENPGVLIAGLSSLSGWEKIVATALLSFIESEIDLTQLIPKNKYWPVTGKAKEPTTEFTYGDGGILDNYGIISLIRKGVKNLVVFINTSTKIDINYDPAQGAPKAEQLDSNLAPLFGYKVPSPGIFTQHNQVFPKNEFAAVFNALKEAKIGGRTVMVEQTHTVCQNPWWGVNGVELNRAGNPKNRKAAANDDDNKINVVWVYNERVQDWENLLTTDKFHAKGLGDVTLEKAIQAGNPADPSTDPAGPFQNFPNYATAFQNGKTSVVELTPEQVNLLANLSCWNITHNAPVFRKILNGGQ